MRTRGGNEVGSINNFQCAWKENQKKKAQGANVQEIRTLRGIDPRERRRNSRKSGNVRRRKREAHGKPACNHDSKGYKDRVKITSTEKQHQSRTETSRVTGYVGSYRRSNRVRAKYTEHYPEGWRRTDWQEA